MPLAASDVALLSCPRCGGSLGEAGESLVCTRCRASFDVRDGVPDLLPWSGGAPGPEWARWREKLDLLSEWRRATWDESAAAGQRQKVAENLAAEFFEFARVPQTGPVLEIGCGTGALRRYLPRRRYWGLDPMPASARVSAGEDRRDTSMVLLRGVGERLPLADGVFGAVLLCETLDHCLDPRLVIREARRVLKAGGILAILQGVRHSPASPPLHRRLRVAAGRLRARVIGSMGGLGGMRRAVPSDEQTKTHLFEEADLAALVSAEVFVESAAIRGNVMFLRAVSRPEGPGGSGRGPA